MTQNSAFLSESALSESVDFRHEALPQILQRTPGLVLIDEIDVHLHPKWQRQIVNDLKTTFPSIQFVCTTHSPFIIQSIVQGELRSLDLVETDMLEYENQPIEDIAGEIQRVESPQQSQKARELVTATEHYFELLQDPETRESTELAAAEAAYRKAAESFSANPGLTALLKLEAMAKARERAE